VYAVKGTAGPPRPAPTLAAPRPVTDWPLAARSLALLRHDADAGLGDTAHRLAAVAGGETLASLYTRLFGRDCGCGDRRAALNAAYPYPAVPPPDSDLITRRNLLYHLYPIAGDHGGAGRWQWNVAELVRRLGLFNGRRVIAVATDERTDTFEMVRAAFGPWADAVEFLHVENCADLREVATHELLLERIASLDPAEATLYAHGKGVTHGGTEHLQPVRDEAGREVLWPRGGTTGRWVDALYRVMMDYWPLVAEHLQDYSLTGAFRSRGSFPVHPQVNWLYQGSWVWYRHGPRGLFARDWRSVGWYWAGVEPYPGQLFTHEEAGCLFGDGAADLYDHQFFHQVITPALAAWQEANTHLRTPSGLLIAPPSIRVQTVPATPARPPRRGEIAVAMPGKIGDALYALPACRALAERHGCPVDFHTSEHCRPLVRLLEYQSCVRRVVVPPAYRVAHHDCGTQPWLMPVRRDDYDAVYQLGFRRTPELVLPDYLAGLAGVEVGPVRYDTPVGDPGAALAPYVCLAPGGSDSARWRGLYAGFARRCPLPVVQVGAAGEGLPGVGRADVTGLDMLDTLPWLAGCAAFVGGLSAMLVLANGYGCRKVVPVAPDTPNLHHVLRTPAHHYPVSPTADDLLRLVVGGCP
jgi:hypothetical protein